jgi:23S rRNA pseudouridine1911/1915/1917 synthase
VKNQLDILYEDNHLIAVNKNVSDIVQGDKTGDMPLSEKVKLYIKEKYNKPGLVYLGLPHRLDRPTSGIVLFAKTSKALTRLNKMFQDRDLRKVYWAIVSHPPENPEGSLEHYLSRNEKQNKSYAFDEEKPQTKKAILLYKQIAQSDKYTLLQIELKTGRHHQIRAQLAHIGLPIKGDLKYGAKRSNPDKGISLHARQLQFIHPIKKEQINIVAPVPQEALWQYFEKELSK